MKTFVVLCGGFGTRFQKVSKNIPKILAEIKPGLTMLDFLIREYLPPKSKIILAAGHLHEKIFEYSLKKEYLDCLLIVKEKEKLGTGGALINAARFINSDEFIAINGDTIQELSIENFLKKANLSNGAFINVGCTTKNKNDSGKILVDKNEFIISFTEKKLPNISTSQNLKTVTSLGMYLCSTHFFRNSSICLTSLEEKLLPELVSQKKAKASIFNNDYSDFGTNERYRKLFKN